MPNYFNLLLDTLGPQDVKLLINDGANFSPSTSVNLGISTTDGDTTGYEMKIWGSVDPAIDPTIQVDEVSSQWIAFSATKAITLSDVDGLKTINVRLRDDVYNESAVATDTITIDTAAPIVTIGAPSVTKISKKATKDTCTFSFTVDTDFDEYKVCVVASVDAAHGAGVVIATTNGSANMSGDAGAYAGATAINCTIKGTDLEVASGGDGTQIIKVFAKDAAGNWSI